MSHYPVTGTPTGAQTPAAAEYTGTIRLLSKKELAKKYGCSLSTIDNRLNPNSPWYDETFPKPIELGAGGSRSSAKRWIEHVADKWPLTKLEQSGGAPL